MDNVNHPAHYVDHCSLECIQVMKLVLGRTLTIGFCFGNAFKYMWRWKYKNGEEDLNKAMWYLITAKDVGFQTSEQQEVHERLLDLLNSLDERGNK